MGKLDGKIALVTGAGNGMGQATAKLFAEEGATVFAADIMEDALKQWEDVETVIPIHADITKIEDIDHMFDEADSRFGGIDIVCNVAGMNDLCYTLEDTTDERYDRVFELDVKAPFRICRRAVKSMEQRGGAIVNIGSYAAVRGNHGPSYTAAKSALVGLTRSIAVAYAKKGIRCNIITPGGTNTEIALHSGGAYHEAG
ncbi:MAG: SDR family oxidoreductase, partial [Clostridiales bacterium]|nr:SDR family oxidoreductase [Clostridiales bacterium]